MSAPVTGPVVINVTQAAELNSLFMTWLETKRPELDAVGRVRSLRAANWQATTVDLFEETKRVLESWVD